MQRYRPYFETERSFFYTSNRRPRERRSACHAYGVVSSKRHSASQNDCGLS